MYDSKALERYRNAVTEKSKAQEYRRTAVQHCDTYRAIDKLAYWTQEVKDSLKALQGAPN